ncbi:MAG: hypothetical protein ACRDDA_09655, partial [Aeromonas sp.]
MADFDLENFISAPTVEQLDVCKKDDLLRVAEHFQIVVPRQQLKRDIKRVIEQHLEEQGVLVLAGSSSGADARYLRLDKGEAGGAVAAEVSEAKTALPSFEPFSPGESGGAVRLRLRLAELQSEERKSLADSHAERELRLEIRRLEIEADTQIKLRELDLNAARDAPVPPVQLAPTAASPIDPGLPGRTFDVSKNISL